MSAAAKKIYLFANWKMYLNYAESRSLARALKKTAHDLPQRAGMAVFPSALAMVGVKEELSGSPVLLGAQNTYWVDRGGYTGEVSSAMYKAVGVRYALVGHSERRTIFHENNHDVRQKIEALLAVGITPVVCIGETKPERQDGSAEEVVEAQLRAAFTDLAWPEGRELIIAYEPVWAVNTGEPCAPEEAGRMCSLLKKNVAGLLGDIPAVFLYGGSVRPENVGDFIRQTDISGVLVGGASAKLETWSGIMAAAVK
ncbi:MAG: triose-phosphate isomerase [Candidatus Magasanikbacteria bacterium]|nr:triose-phosphate isomerase [Candidatus Magasanikbacteria bacterium]